MTKLGKKGKVKNFFKCLFICLIIGFIWGNSMLPGAESSEFSGFFTKTFINIFDKLFGITLEARLVGFFIRKLAHFSEYFILGFCEFWFFKPKLYFTLPFGLIVAGIDEAIQRFTPGRCGCLSDVCIDFSGYFVGTLVIMGIYFLIRRREQKKKEIF